MLKYRKIVKSRHYKRYHEKKVSWDIVYQIILTTKYKRKGKDIFEFKTKKYYVLTKREDDKLKVINAKKLK